MADLATLKSQLDTVTAAKMNAFNQINSTTFDAQAAYNAMQTFNPEGKTYSEFWTGSYEGQTFSDPQALYAYVQQDFTAKDAKARAVRQEFNAKLAEENDLKAQIEALPPEASAESKPEAQAQAEQAAGANTTNPQGEAYSAKAAAETSSNESPTNNNAGQKDYSNNGSDNPPATGFGDDQEEFTTDSLGNTYKNGQLYRAAEVEEFPSQESSSRVGPSMVSKVVSAAQATWKEANDLRAILRVPPSYLTSFTDPTGALGQFGGIVFPYTPSISFDHQATYNAINPLHSNYTQYTYKNSAVGTIQVNAKFTVQNEKDGVVLLGVIHLLRALTKMKFGPDADAGAPPPVCRFDSYGTFMLKNIPVTVASFRHELQEGVDYISVGRSNGVYGPNLLPTISSISLTLNPTYSRSEQMAAGVDNWLSGAYKGKGYL